MGTIVCGGCGKEIATRIPDGRIRISYRKFSGTLEWDSVLTTPCTHFHPKPGSYRRFGENMRVEMERCGFINRLEAVREPAGAA
jgi:hypothetical protein